MPHLTESVKTTNVFLDHDRIRSLYRCWEDFQEACEEHEIYGTTLGYIFDVACLERRLPVEDYKYLSSQTLTQQEIFDMMQDVPMELMNPDEKQGPFKSHMLVPIVISWKADLLDIYDATQLPLANGEDRPDKVPEDRKSIFYRPQRHQIVINRMLHRGSTTLSVEAELIFTILNTNDTPYEYDAEKKNLMTGRTWAACQWDEKDCPAKIGAPVNLNAYMSEEFKEKYRQSNGTAEIPPTADYHELVTDLDKPMIGVSCALPRVMDMIKIRYGQDATPIFQFPIEEQKKEEPESVPESEAKPSEASNPSEPNTDLPSPPLSLPTDDKDDKPKTEDDSAVATTTTTKKNETD